MARLDRVCPRLRAVAQLGATIGRQFAYDLLQAVSPLEEGTLQKGLRELVAAELLYQRGMPPQATYIFKHALIQDAAYQSLLKSTRQQHHQGIAQVLEAKIRRDWSRHNLNYWPITTPKTGLPCAGHPILAAGRATRQRSARRT